MNPPAEIERKFLVTEVPSGLDPRAGHATIQGYLAADDSAEVRIRRKGASCTLTVKQGGGLRRAEYEVGIDNGQFDSLWPATDGRRVEKTRFQIELGSFTAELDLYRGCLDGLMTVEVEFDSVKDADAFSPPAWFGRELTGDPRFANRNLAVNGRPPLD